MANTPITVDQWISVRSAVASAMQTKDSFEERQTAAERLMSLGYIDIEVVLDSIAPAPDLEPERTDEDVSDVEEIA